MTMKKNKAIISIIAFISIIITALACSSSKREKYSFTTDKITIIYNNEGDSFEITDGDVLKNIIDMCNNASYSPVTNEANGMCSMWIDFHNGLIMGMYKDLNYGYVGHSIEEVPVDTYDTYLPKKINYLVSSLIAEYLDKHK